MSCHARDHSIFAQLVGTLEVWTTVLTLPTMAVHQESGARTQDFRRSSKILQAPDSLSKLPICTVSFMMSTHVAHALRGYDHYVKLQPNAGRVLEAWESASRSCFSSWAIVRSQAAAGVTGVPTDHLMVAAAPNSQDWLFASKGELCFDFSC